MTALANENGATPAQGDADDALAPPMVEVENAPNPAEDEIARRRREREAAQRRGGPDLAHGLELMTEEGAAEWQRRREVHFALRGPYWEHNYVLFPAFTEADLEYTTWRPWGRILDPSDIDPGTRRKAERFQAILGALDAQHEDRHWFYAHPFCRGCFADNVWPDGKRFSVVEHRLAHWMLRNGERGFPADQWDGVVPPMPHEGSAVDFLTDADLNDLPEPSWLLDGLLPENATGVLRARDQSFKSFMALDMALRVVSKGKRVLYCIGEGANQFKHRRDAWLEHSGWDVDDLGDGLHYLPAVPNLFTGGDLYDRVLARARSEQYDLIIIDTYARATAGGDINSQQDQSIVTTRVDELKRISGGTVLLVAHSQKSDTDSSGSIEIEDARDFVFAMKRSGNEVTFEVTKQKDGVESTKPIRYVTKPVGKSIVLVEAGEGDPNEPLMTTRDWIFAALDNTQHLGAQSETQIRGWINDHQRYRQTHPKPMSRGTCSSELSRLVGDEQIVKVGTRFALPEAAS